MRQLPILIAVGLAAATTIACSSEGGGASATDTGTDSGHLGDASADIDDGPQPPPSDTWYAPPLEIDGVQSVAADEYGVFIGTDDGLYRAEGEELVLVDETAGADIRSVRALEHQGAAVGARGDAAVIFLYSANSDEWSEFETETERYDPESLGVISDFAGFPSQFHVLVGSDVYTFDSTGLFGGPTFSRDRDGSLVKWNDPVTAIEVHMGRLFAGTSQFFHRRCDTSSRNWCADEFEDDTVVPPQAAQSSTRRMRNIDSELFAVGASPPLVRRDDMYEWVEVQGLPEQISLSGLSGDEQQLWLSGDNGTIIVGTEDDWVTLNLPTDDRIVQIDGQFGQPSVMWALTEQGELWRCEGTCDTPDATP
jgi:hypothetical protein